MNNPALRGRPPVTPVMSVVAEACAPVRTYAIRAREDASSPDVITGEHRRVKRERNGPKTEKIDQHVKSTRPGLPYTGKPHARVVLAGSSTARTSLHSLEHGLKKSKMGVSHVRVPVEPKFSLIRKRPLLRDFRHSKAYLNTLEEG
ncbi:Dihydrodipicolinate synthase [Gossypium arboreum]|uniref:Dihydrodipicolinate synthase n=1 Tax=Gossypium arboreum TaxID=29729 RepID=A0A0B0NKH0_GOSAR|nr:Dihydrodipicolinate synthase [Gossypium arboreum]